LADNALLDSRTVIEALCGSFGRQLAVYKELRDAARASMSKIILSRGDVGVLMAGIDKKTRLLAQIDQEKASISGEIEYWQAHRESLANDRDAAALNEILSQTETVIKEFLAEEEKLKQYMEKVYKPDTGDTQNGAKGGA
jgi:hypothetical protein